MQFTSSIVMSLALAITASAAPVVGEGVEGKVLVERQVVQQMSSVSCNTNTQTKGFDRAKINEKINEYCTKHWWEEIKDGYSGAMDTFDMGDGYSIRLGPQGKNGCTWNIDALCPTMLRKPVDNCNTEGENNKKGGKYDDQCATWTLEFYKN
ncbi:hypothetical protein MBLNU13_g00044t1 [Cladosporium sp. NU13]